ncbi:MAG: MATE family efflux transporter, partial [Algoriphagus sp.]
YIDNEEVIALSASLLIIAGLFQLSDGIQVAGLGVLRGMEDVKFPTVITLVAYWVLGLPLGYFLAFEMGLAEMGIWYGLLIGLTVTAIVLFVRFHKLSKRMIASNKPTVTE